MSDLSAIRDWVREQTLVETSDWSNAKVLNVINQGIRDLSTRFPWPFLAASNTLSAVADQQAYTFDTISDFSGTGQKLFSIAAIVDNDKRVKLDEVHHNDAFKTYGGDMPTTSEAVRFFTWGESIYLLPTPDTSDTDRYTVYYFRSPAELSNDTDSPEWDARFHMVIAEYAISKVWEREEEIGKARQAFNAYLDGVDRMASFYLNRAQDYPVVMGGGKPLGQPYLGDDRQNMTWLN